MKITAKFQGKCAKCGGTIHKGDEIEYEKKTSSAWHPDCFEDEGGQQDYDAEFLAASLGYVASDEPVPYGEWRLWRTTVEPGNGRLF